MPAHTDIPLTPQHLAMREPGPLRGALARCNAQLPPGIRVVALAPAPRGWHAQFSSLGKTYLYQVHVAPAPDPLLRRTHYHCASRRALRAPSVARIHEGVR
jgi:tRNA U38,U39,U40 pseudouridine synthase TruA